MADDEDSKSSTETMNILIVIAYILNIYLKELGQLHPEFDHHSLPN